MPSSSRLAASVPHRSYAQATRPAGCSGHRNDFASPQGARPPPARGLPPTSQWAERPLSAAPAACQLSLPHLTATLCLPTAAPACPGPPPAVTELAPGAATRGPSFVAQAHRGGLVALRRAVFTELQGRYRQDPRGACRDLAAALQGVGTTRACSTQVRRLLQDLLTDVHLQQALGREGFRPSTAAPQPLAQTLLDACTFLVLGDLTVLGFVGEAGSTDCWAAQQRRLRLALCLPARWQLGVPATFAKTPQGAWQRPLAVACVLLVEAAAKQRLHGGQAALLTLLVQLSAGGQVPQEALVAARAAWA